MTEALLFDYNGVITDDEEQHRASFAELLAEIGIPLSRDQYYAEYLGCDDRTAFAAISTMPNTWGAMTGLRSWTCSDAPASRSMHPRSKPSLHANHGSTRD